MTTKITYTNIRPNLVVSNLEKSLKFYRDLLDFNVETTMGEPTNFAIISKDGASMSLVVHDDVYDVGWAWVNMYIDVVNVEDLYEHCKSSGIKISYDLATHPWGMKDFTMVDPDGHQIAFGERQ